MKFTRILFARKKVFYEGRGEEFKYWQRYLFREKAHVRGPEVNRPLVGYQKTTKHNWYYDENLPMTTSSENRQTHGKMPLVKPFKEWSIFIGDRVEVMVGRDKGKIGEVIEIIKERNWCFVEGLHLEIQAMDIPGEKKYLRNQCPYYYKEKPLLVTHEVKLVDPSDQRATNIQWRYTQDGNRVRVSVRSGRIIPTPMKHQQTWEDNINALKIKPTDKDTTDANLTKVTFKAARNTFEQDILQNRGIETWPRKKRSYWY